VIESVAVESVVVVDSATIESAVVAEEIGRCSFSSR
jgi:hypothetical protein